MSATMGVQRYTGEVVPGYWTAGELAELSLSQRVRCLGCGAALPGEGWSEHGSCRPYYGAGQRVSYEAWSALLDRFTDEPLFRVWEEAESMLGLPSWFSPELLASIFLAGWEATR